MKKEELREYRSIKKKISQLQEEKNDLLYLSGKKENGIKSSIIPDPTSNAAIKINEINMKIDYMLEKLYERRYMIEKVISSLPEKEYCLMHMYYILGYSWERVAEELGYSYQWTCILHGRILKKIYNT